MLNKIIGFSIRNKAMVGLAVLLLIIFGVYQLRRLPIDALPDITSNQVQVITVSPALAAPEVERLVTFVIEQACANIPGMTEMRSISRFGLSVVTLVFNDDADVYWARQQVAERMSGIREQIPPGAGMPELAPLTTGLGEVYQYILRPRKGFEDRYSLAELRTMQDWIVRRQLLGVPGVADVSSFGGHLKQYEVAVDPARLQAMNVTISDVFAALEANNQNSGGGYIEKGPTAQFIRVEGFARSADDIGMMVVRQTAGGLPVLVRDVARVTEGHALRYGALVYEDKGEAVGAVVLMLKSANASQVVKQIKARMDQIQASLPDGVDIVPFYDRTKVVDRALQTVTMNLTEGALIVVFVLVIFLGNLRAGLIVASVIPLSMLFAFVMMNLFGVSGNLMSLGALDFGLIVDGAVIIVEAVLHKLHSRDSGYGLRKLTQSEMDQTVHHSAGRMMNAAIFGQIIIFIVYLPILSLSGIEGKMFRPMAQTVAFALLGALLLSLTYVPMMSSLFISKKWDGKPTRADRMVAWLQRRYRPVLHSALARPWRWLAGVATVIALSVWLLSHLGGEFIPELEEGDFAVDTRLLAGTSLTHSIEVAQTGARILRERFPEIERIVSRIGASEIPTDPMPMEMGDMIILLKPKKEWTSASSFDELADTMSRALAQIPGMTAGFQFPIQMRFNELISGARQDVVCKIFGENLDSLAGYAARMGHLVSTVNGAADLYVETVTGLPQIQVSYRREALARYGVSISDVNRIVRSAFAGASAGWVYENERRFDLVVRLDQQRRGGVEDVRQLLIPVSGGQQVPLYLLADVDIVEGPNQIQRELGRRRIIVGFNVRGRDVESVVHELRDKVTKQLRLPPGYSVHYGGAFENLAEARGRLAVAVPVALLLIFFLLYLAFGKVGPGLVIFSAIPLSAIGGIIALWLRDMPFSISAGIGFIALFGVSVLNGIVLLTEIRRLQYGGDLTLREAIETGCLSRLRPVLMTASVASLGFLPMALSQRAGAEVQRPLATVVIGGLVTATLLTLIVLPILYQWMETRKLKGAKAAVSLMLLVFLSLPGFTQVPEKQVSLEEALNRVRTSHWNIELGRLRETYQQTLIGSARYIPKAQTEAEFGQNEGPFFDLRLSAIQPFMPVGSHRRQEEWLRSLYDVAKTETVLARTEAERLVRTLFAIHQALELEYVVYERMDTLVAKSALLAERRLRAGETDMLEKVNVDQLLGSLRQQMVQVDWEMNGIRRQLGVVLGEPGGCRPVQPVDWQNLSAAVLTDTAALAAHPLVRLRESEAAAAARQTEAERSLLRPEWQVGVNSISVTGWQTSKDGQTERYYDLRNRFVSGQVGLAFPLFTKAQRAKIDALRQQEQVARQGAIVQHRELSLQYERVLSEWKSLQQQLLYYEREALPRAETIMQTAQRRFAAGSIQYLEWSLLMQQALQVQLQHALARKSAALKLIELRYYTEP